MKINKEQNKFLRALTHDLSSIIRIGQNGLSKNVLTEINTALDHHELIKIKIRAGDRELRDQIAEDICKQTAAESIQKIGNIVVVFRRNKKSLRSNFQNRYLNKFIKTKLDFDS